MNIREPVLHPDVREIINVCQLVIIIFISINIFSDWHENFETFPANQLFCVK